MITRQDVLDAQANLSKEIRQTGYLDSRFLSNRTGAKVKLHLETLQRTGAYKIRGAWNAMRQLSREQLNRGVITASAGNHAQGVALAAQWLDTCATIVMPQNAPLTKIVQTQSYGEPRIVLHGSNYDEAEAHAHEIERETGGVYIHPFDDDAIIAGQGTVGLRILEELPEVDAIIVPVGGGGLIAGVCVAVKEARPNVKIIGVQAAGADSAVRSLEGGTRVKLDQVETVADGIKVKQLGQRTYDIIAKYVDRIVRVSDEEICEACMHLFEKAKLTVEPAGCVGVAALLGSHVNLPKEQVAIVLSGANVDPPFMLRIITRGLRSSGRLTTLRVKADGDPGCANRVISTVGSCHAMLLDLRLDRDREGMAFGETTFTLELQTRDHAHLEEIIRSLDADGFDCEKVN